MATESFLKTAANILDTELTFGAGAEQYKADRIKDWMWFSSSIDYVSVDWLTDLLFVVILECM